jgi:hypothetical protein
MHTKTKYVFMFQFSHNSFGPLMTTRLKIFLVFINVVLCLLSGVAPLHYWNSAMNILLVLRRRLSTRRIFKAEFQYT